MPSWMKHKLESRLPGETSITSDMQMIPSSEFKILQARLQHYGNRELKMYKMGFEEAEKSEIKLPTFVGSWRKQSSQK